MAYEFTSRKRRDLMREGRYEVYLKSCGEVESRNGDKGIEFEFVVRPDIEQPYQNKHKSKTFWFDQDSGGLKQKDAEKIADWAVALGIPEGEQADTDELIGCSCVMAIKHFTNDKGDTFDYISYLKGSEADPYIRMSDSRYEEVGDDDGDLPF